VEAAVAGHGVAAGNGAVPGKVGETASGFFDDHQRYGLEAEAIVRPLFATGEPRSGTTLLHALLSVDPDARAMRFWEVMYPSPPPGLAAPRWRGRR